MLPPLAPGSRVQVMVACDGSRRGWLPARVTAVHRPECINDDDDGEPPPPPLRDYQRSLLDRVQRLLAGPGGTVPAHEKRRRYDVKFDFGDDEEENSVPRERIRIRNNEAMVSSPASLAGDGAVDTLVAAMSGLSVKRPQEETATAAASALLYLPTGGGKTHVAAELMLREAEAGRRCLFVVNRTPLVQQTVDTLVARGLRRDWIGCIEGAGEKEADVDRPVQIATIQSLLHRWIAPASLTNDDDDDHHHDLCRRPPPFAADLLVIDEAHCAEAASYKSLIRRFTAGSSCQVLGLTATPFRTSFEENLANCFEEFVPGPDIGSLIGQGVLVPPEIYGPQYPLGDKVTPEDIASAVDKWFAHCHGKRTIAFCATIADSKRLVDVFTARGVAAEHVDGRTAAKRARATYGRLRDGLTLVVSSVRKLDEGFDEPSVEAIVCLNKLLNSRVRHIQSIGRGLRCSPATAKTKCVVIDEVGNTYRFGSVAFPLAFDWGGVSSTEGRDAEPKSRQWIHWCECGRIMAESTRKQRLCASCGKRSVAMRTVKDERDRARGDAIKAKAKMAKAKMAKAKVVAAAAEKCTAVGEMHGRRRRLLSDIANTTSAAGNMPQF